MAGPTIRLTFAGDSTDLERTMGRVGDSADQMERTFSAKSLALGAAGAAAGAGLVDAFTNSMEFDDASAKLEAQMGAGSPIAAAAGEAAGSLYANAYGESIGEVNDAVKSVAQNISGMSSATAGELESVTGQMMSLATVMEVDVGTASQAVGQMIRNGLAKDAVEAMDLLAAGSQKGADRMGDLAEVFSEYGETFQTAGLSGAEAMGIMTQAMDAGAWSADLVADGIREFGIIAQSGAKPAAEAFAALGLDAGKMAEDVAAGGARSVGAMDQVLDKLRAMPPSAERSQLAVALFGTKAEEMGDSLMAIDPSAATAALGEFGGKAAEVNDTLGDTAANKITAVKRGFDDWMMSIVGVEGPLGNVAAGVVGMGTEAVSTAGSVGMAAMALRGLGIGTGIATAAQWLWNAALSANPIGIVVVAIAALVAGLIYAWNNSETFRGIVLGVWDAVKNGISGAVDWIVGAISWFGELPGKVGGWFGSMKDTAIRKAGELVSWLGGLPGRVMGAIGSFGSLLLNAGHDLLSGLWNGITGAAGWLRSKVLNFFGSILPGWAKDILGIRSPSKVFADLGQYIPLGMAKGITDNIGAVSIASAQMAAAAASGAQSGLGAASAELLAHINSGGSVFEDMSFRGMSDNLRQYNDDLAAMYQRTGGSLTGFLQSQQSAAVPAAGTAGGSATVTFRGNTSDALATVIMQMVRTGQIQIGGR